MLTKVMDLMMPFHENKPFLDKGGDVYLESTSTHSEHDVWFIDLSASFHITSHKEQFCEYGKYKGGGVFIEYDSILKTIGRGNVKMLLKDGWVRTLLGILHILDLSKNLIYVGTIGDVGVHTAF